METIKERTGRSGALAVAFDMDGLMFETESVYYKTAVELLGRRGFRYTQELCDETMGRPPRYCFERYIELFHLPEDWKTLQAESDEIFIRLLQDGYETTPGLIELFDELDRRRIPRGVCTSSASRVARKVLAKDRIIERLDFVLTSDDVTNGKPHPEVYLTAARRFGVASSRVLVLEDSSAGCASACAAGSPCCMLRASHNFNADFSRAVEVVERLDAPELLALLRD